MERKQADEEDKNVERWGRVRIWIGIIRSDIGSRKHVRLTPMRDALAQIQEILESVVGYEEHGVARIGLMQNVPADASETPGKCGQYQECHYIDSQAFVH